MNAIEVAVTLGVAIGGRGHARGLVAGRGDDGGVRLRVRDTGPGMTAEEIVLALEPFKQLDTTPRRQAGTGLGLPLARAFVEANRAQFKIESERGAGTSIDVTFAPDRVVP